MSPDAMPSAPATAACGCNPAGPGPDNAWGDGPPYYDEDCPVHGRPEIIGRPATAAWLARLLRRLADRIDHHGAPKALGMWFTFERGRGLVVNQDGHGCRLWYYGDDDYEKAHTEAVDGT